MNNYFGENMRNKIGFPIFYVVTMVLLAGYSIGRLLEVLPPMIVIPPIIVIPFAFELGRDDCHSIKRKILASLSVAVLLWTAIVASF